MLGLVQMSLFSCAEPNAHELEQRILLIYIRFVAWEERRLKWSLVLLFLNFVGRIHNFHPNYLKKSPIDEVSKIQTIEPERLHVICFFGSVSTYVTCT